MKWKNLHIVLFALAILFSALTHSVKAEVKKEVTPKSKATTEQVIIKAQTEALVPFTHVDFTEPVNFSFEPEFVFSPSFSEASESTADQYGYLKILLTRIQPAQAP